MGIDDWDEYRNKTQMMISILETCISSLVRSRNNIVISRSGNVDGVGMVSKVDQSQTDDVIMIAGFDICANKNKEDNE